jgi:hypothetical protein
MMFAINMNVVGNSERFLAKQRAKELATVGHSKISRYDANGRQSVFTATIPISSSSLGGSASTLRSDESSSGESRVSCRSYKMKRKEEAIDKVRDTILMIRNDIHDLDDRCRVQLQLAHQRHQNMELGSTPSANQIGTSVRVNQMFFRTC